MLSTDEQEEIILANREAFEELARRWRNPQTGLPEPDLKQAMINMVCEYFSVPGYIDLYTELAISKLYDALANEVDARNPLQLTDENQLSAEARAALKRLKPDDDIPPGWRPLAWQWDESEWDWELEVRDTVENVDDGYIAIVPLKNGDRFEYKIKPPPSHSEWAIRFVCGVAKVAIPDLLIKGSLSEAKRRLDMLLGVNTPEIPLAALESL